MRKIRTILAKIVFKQGAGRCKVVHHYHLLLTVVSEHHTNPIAIFKDLSFVAFAIKVDYRLPKAGRSV